MAILPGKFVWFECVTPDPAAAQRFYGETLGWAALPPDIAWARGAQGASAWTSTVTVLSLDAALHAVTVAGGKVLTPAREVPGAGRVAEVADPEGAALSVTQSRGQDAPDGPPALGRFVWHELRVSDGARALAFYRRAFGYVHHDLDRGPSGTYHVLSASGAPRGSIVAAPEAGARWLPHAAVEDCDVTVERARRLGARVEIPPEALPGLGRTAVLRDPFGARFAVIEPAVQKLAPPPRVPYDPPMEVEERAVREAVHKVEAEPSTGDAAWFAARQPGIVKYLEGRCGRDDGMGVALLAALAIHTAFERTLGVPPPRVPWSALARAELAVVAETHGGRPSFASRQQALTEFVAGVVAAPPVPLGDDETTRLALVLASVVHALDESVRA